MTRRLLILAAMLAALLGLTVACAQHDTGGMNPASPIYAHCV